MRGEGGGGERKRERERGSESGRESKPVLQHPIVHFLSSPLPVRHECFISPLQGETKVMKGA
jgi:hypothetical protein